MAEFDYLEPTPVGTATTFDYAPATSGNMVPSNDNNSPFLESRNRNHGDIIEGEIIESTPDAFESYSDFAERMWQKEVQGNREIERQYQDDLREARRQAERERRYIQEEYQPSKYNNYRRAQRYAEAIGSALSGYGAYRDSRAQGNGLGESIGKGVGNAIGATVGANQAATYAGTKTAAATGMNPVATGAAVAAAGIAGGLAGGAVGEAVGGAIGRTFDKIADWIQGEDPARYIAPIEEGESKDPLAGDDIGVDGFYDFAPYGGCSMRFRTGGSIQKTKNEPSVLNFTLSIEILPSGNPKWLIYWTRCDGNTFSGSNTGQPITPEIYALGSCGQPNPTQQPKKPGTRKPTAPVIGLPIPDFPSPFPEGQPKFEPIPRPINQPNPETDPKPTPIKPPGWLPIPVDPFPVPTGNPEPKPEPELDPEIPPIPPTREPIDSACDPCSKLDDVLAVLTGVNEKFNLNFNWNKVIDDCDGEGSYNFSAQGEGLQGIWDINEQLFSFLELVWEKVKCEPETHGSIPESFIAKAPTIKPQLQVQFKEKDSKSGSRWHITIPHFNEAFKDNFSLSDYRKGDIRCVLALTDNTKIIVNAESESGGITTIQECLSYVLPQYQTSINETSFHKIPGRGLKKVTVEACYAKYFEGTLDNPPKWIRKLST